MTDAPLGRSAVYTILTTGYVGSTGPGVAATVSYISDAGRHVIFDPGMVASHDDILAPLAELGLGPDDITDVVLSHHHPDNTMNVGLFGRARVHDHKVEYLGNQWRNRDAEGVAPDREVLRASRLRVLTAADLIVPGHGGPFKADDTTPR
ncbi:MBL fold metallo-hydrolase [Streptomyces sp. MZ04]|uniref:MBL fold metallo-hydrolase n=1 Tax=Streptomyces sp. MZ04 TaxID=2559236 RepID=UPI00107EC989|nr:MBL fold metallo-hydrolase [Streptomyces sp. MZ04]TGB05766.1 MBL fold metallo-hydrolase [Streptomyces sp. MZ04]